MESEGLDEIDKANKTNELDDITASLNISRERRRSLVLYVNTDGILVKAPLRTSMKEINQFIEEKQQWIKRTLRKMKERDGRARAIYENNHILYRGLELPLIKEEGVNERNAGMVLGDMSFDGVFYISKKAWPRRYELVVNWLKQKAKHELPAKLNEWARACSLEPTKTRITNARTVWGSCSFDGHVNLSWRLIMAPDYVQDAVIVHELAHLKHKNHSRRFYEELNTCFPAYKKGDEWLETWGLALIPEKYVLK